MLGFQTDNFLAVVFELFPWNDVELLAVIGVAIDWKKNYFLMNGGNNTEKWKIGVLKGNFSERRVIELMVILTGLGQFASEVIVWMLCIQEGCS